MEDERKNRILEAATEIFAKDGYTQAKVYNISEKAGVATGVIYSPNFFKNKLDLLLSIILNFWKTLNYNIESKVNKIDDHVYKLHEIINILEDLLCNSKKSLFLAKVLHESLPHMYHIKNKELKIKRQKITEENKKTLIKVDKIIQEGQNKGSIDNSLNPSVMRQALYGAFQMLMYGLFLELSKRGKEKQEETGYNKTDAQKAMNLLIKKFLAANK